MTHDILNETEPQNKLKRPSYPRIADLDEALLTVNGGASYTQDRLNAMTKNDKISAARIHELEVNGLTPITPPEPDPEG